MNYIFILFLFFWKLFPLVKNLFYAIEIISDETNDYFVILDDGLYIYNFENLKYKLITNLSKSIFEENEAYNNIIISRNINTTTKEIKIAALINQNLFVYNYNTTKLENNSIESLIDTTHNTFPFFIQINDTNLKIYLIKYEKDPYAITSTKHFLKTFFFQNYLAINNKEPKTNIYKDNYVYKPICIFDIYNSLIKCVNLNNYDSNFLFYITSNDLKEIETLNIDFNSETNIGVAAIGSKFKIITLSCSKERTFICYQKTYSGTDKTICQLGDNSKHTSNEISYSFENDCLDIKTKYVEERNEFVFICKKENNFFLYIFNESDTNNNIIYKNISISDYKGNYSIIYNNKIHDYDIIFDNYFNQTFYNEENKDLNEINENCSHFHYYDDNNTYCCTNNSFCPDEFTKLIEDKRECVKSRNLPGNNIYKYEYKNKCYKNCPQEAEESKEKKYFCESICDEKNPFLIVPTQECVDFCEIKDLISKKCELKYIGNDTDEKILEIKGQDIYLGNLEKALKSKQYDLSILNQGNEEKLIYKKLNIILTTTEIQNNNEDNVTKILLGLCENKLREVYKMSDEDKLYIKKIDIILN